MAASYDSFGSSRFPLIPSAAMQSAALYDKGLSSLIGLLSAAIEADTGVAWRHLIKQLDTTSFLRNSTSPVGSVITVLPEPQNLTQVGLTWPILAIYREGRPERDLLSMSYLCRRQQWAVDWIVGSLGPDTQRKIGHFWLQVQNSIWTAIELGHHPSYQNGAYQFFGEFVSIIPIASEGPAVSEHLKSDKGAGYFGGSVVLESVERLTFQSKASGDNFNAGAYLPPGDGYGDNATQGIVDVDFDNRTEPVPPITDL